MTPSPRYICIHGHFYQPPRENAWLEAIEMQESAYPDHDWNERISRECYATNGKARVLDDQDRLVRVISNYARMSFDFGPTLLAWLAEKAPSVHEAVVAADRASAERFGGHGSAIAQAYNHMIVPLCNERDRRTQVRWGIADFRSRFDRDPEGMWLPETAANTDSLESLAEHGIRFTILAPRQAARVRPIGSDEWTELKGDVDPSQAYLCRLPSGRTISLFFYDGPISQGVAFEGLLNSGDLFAERLISAFDDARDHAQLAHIATDGESYGHHHRHGEMALAAALERIEAMREVGLVNYGQFLDLHPPNMEIQIHENSSWSCVHGVERWRSDCGCNSGRQGFHQRWRAPLRAALDWLRDAVAPAYQTAAGALLNEPWAARDDYIDILLDRSPATIDAFLRKHARMEITGEHLTKVFELLELQRHAMLMYTSCGWFFDDISGIETVQVIQYAGRVVQLARAALGLELEAEFLDRLARAKGSDPERPDGRVVYEQCVKPAVVDLLRVGAHYAISTAFEDTPSRGEIYAFNVDRREDRRRTSGRARLVIGSAEFESRITTERRSLSYGVLHLGDHTVSCGVREFRDTDQFSRLATAAELAFDIADFAGVIRLFDQEFGDTSYGIASLFRDEQHAVVRKILDSTLAQIDASYRQIYEQHAPMARFLGALSLPVPRRIQMVGSHVLTQSIRQLLQRSPILFTRIRELLDEAHRQGIHLDDTTLSAAARDTTSRATEALPRQADEPEALRELLDLARLVIQPPFHLDPWCVQEVVIDHLRAHRVAREAASRAGDLEANHWLEAYRGLLDTLRILDA